MLIDKLTQFADGVALSTAAPATAKFGSAINLVVAGLDQGEGYPMYLVVLVDTTATSGGSATLSIELVHADNDALTTNVAVLFATAAIPVATLVAGYLVAMVALPKGIEYKQYLGLRQVVGTAALTAGALNAFLTPDPQNWRAYPEGNN